MMKKLTLLAGLGAGYVLGTRAGREQYEKIVGTARSLWNDPRVQEKADQAQQVAKEKAGEAQQAVQDKASEMQSDDSSQSPGLSSVDSPSTSGQPYGGGMP